MKKRKKGRFMYYQHRSGGRTQGSSLMQAKGAWIDETGVDQEQTPGGLHKECKQEQTPLQSQVQTECDWKTMI